MDFVLDEFIILMFLYFTFILLAASIFSFHFYKFLLSDIIIYNRDSTKQISRPNYIGSFDMKIKDIQESLQKVKS